MRLRDADDASGRCHTLSAAPRRAPVPFWQRGVGARTLLQRGVALTLAGAGIHEGGHNRETMHKSLQAALDDVAPLVETRGWIRPAPDTIAAAQRLLGLVEGLPRQPAVQVEPGGTISFEWEAGEHGWLTLSVDDQGQLTHSAVLGGDEFTQAEPFGDTLPDWAATLLKRVVRAGH